MWSSTRPNRVRGGRKPVESVPPPCPLMTRIMTNPTHTTEYEHEMEMERARWVRRRFLWLAGVSLLLAAPFLPLIWLTIPAEGGPREGMRQAQLVRAYWATLTLGLYLAAALTVLVRRRARESTRFTTMLAIALITFVAALSVPVERFAAGTEGTSSLEQLAKERATNSGASMGQNPVDAFRAGFQAGLSGAAPATAPTEGPSGVKIRLGMGTNVEIQLGDDVEEPAAGSTTSPTTQSARAAKESDLVEEVILRSILTPGVRTAFYGVYVVLVTHLIACMFMPWTVRESLIPGAGALGGFSLVLLADAISGQVSSVFALATVATVASSLVPGTLLCWWRYSRFRGEYRLRFESGRYRELRSELASARRIHESCLPAQRLTGPVRVSYAYRPMSDIGGDLLVCRTVGSVVGAVEEVDAPVLAAIIDVTGHGISAALTINRLLGELDRVIGGSSDPQPGAVLAALNTYTRLMLSHHGLYLSACVFRFDPRARTLRFASGGHPTAYRVSTTGGPASGGDFESTATLLGVLPPEQYNPGEIETTLEPGEVIVACTDGATETRLEGGGLLRTAGLREIVRQITAIGTIPPEAIPETVLKRLDAIRPGEVEDDTLIVAFRFA